MDDVRIEMNDAAVTEIMNSPEIQGILSSHASAIASRCGAGYGFDIKTGRTRASARVKAETFAARLDNNKNNTILKAAHP